MEQRIQSMKNELMRMVLGGGYRGKYMSKRKKTLRKSRKYRKSRKTKSKKK